MLDDLLARLGDDGAFRSFLLDGQTVLLEDYLRCYPEQCFALMRRASGARR